MACWSLTNTGKSSSWVTNPRANRFRASPRARVENQKNAAPIWDGVWFSGVRPLVANADIGDFHAWSFDFGAVDFVVLVCVDFELVERAGGLDYLGRLFQPERLGLLTHGITPEFLTAQAKTAAHSIRRRDYRTPVFCGQRKLVCQAHVCVLPFCEIKILYNKTVIGDNLDQKFAFCAEIGIKLLKPKRHARINPSFDSGEATWMPFLNFSMTTQMH